MSRELIKVTNTSYTRYEELLIKRDDARKTAFIREQAYIREFGNLILEVFRMKMDCIRKKKTIEYCQVFANRGDAVDQNALQEYLAAELATYQKQLDKMIKENEVSKNCGRITEAELLKIKKIYHRLVKQIHPDINPITLENEDLMNLWQRLMVAYSCNDLKEMEETEVLINSLLESLDIETVDITIPDIEERIAELEAEIKEITTTDPYMYKYLLEDPGAVAQKKSELRTELKEYKDYCKKLDEILSTLIGKGVTFVWQMN